MRVIFTKSSKKDLTYWKKINPKIYNKIKLLLKSISIKPHLGIGKPEPLVGNLSGFWSRRIDRVNRLVYKVEDGKIIVISCRYHY